MSLVSLTPLAFCVLVSEPLMPLVALVELPPQNGDLSSKRHLPPCSRIVCAAENPARPPPTTMACDAGKMQAPVAGIALPSIASIEKVATVHTVQRSKRQSQ